MSAARTAATPRSRRYSRNCAPRSRCSAARPFHISIPPNAASRRSPAGFSMASTWSGACGCSSPAPSGIDWCIVAREIRHSAGRNPAMADSVYKVIELVGTSEESWEKAAVAAVNKAGKTLRDLRVAEVGRLDLQLKNGKVEAFRARVSVSFKYEGGK